MNRGDLMEQFGMSVNQASTDLNCYIGFPSHDMVCDKGARTYVRGPDYAAQFLKFGASRHLVRLLFLSDGILDSDGTWPSYDVAPTPARGVNPVTLPSVVGATRRSEAIEIKYQSISHPEPGWRWIPTHAIGFDGLRWHTRALCKIDEVFKNFLLSRILQTRGAEASEFADSSDADWQEHVTLETGPHPELSENQKKVIALDYGMRGGKAKIKVRRALLYYALKRLGLDIDPTARRPQEQQIMLLNTAEFGITTSAPITPRTMEG